MARSSRKRRSVASGGTTGRVVKTVGVGLLMGVAFVVGKHTQQEIPDSFDDVGAVRTLSTQPIEAPPTPRREVRSERAGEAVRSEHPPVTGEALAADPQSDGTRAIAVHASSSAAEAPARPADEVPGEVVAAVEASSAARAVAREPAPVAAPPSTSRGEAVVRAEATASPPVAPPSAAPQPVAAAADDSRVVARAVPRTPSAPVDAPLELGREREQSLTTVSTAGPPSRPAPERSRPAVARHRLASFSTWEAANEASESIHEAGVRTGVERAGDEWAVVLTSFRDSNDRDRQSRVANRVLRALP